MADTELNTLASDLFRQFKPQLVSFVPGLLSLTTTRRLPLIKNPGDVYQVVSLFHDLEASDAWTFLHSRVWEDLTETLLSSPLMPQSQIVSITAELPRFPGGVECNRCHSTNTSVHGLQTRGADEAGAAEFKCNVCGFTFRSE